MSVVLSIENISKIYRLGEISTGTFSRDLEVWWAGVRGKPNPLLRIGEREQGHADGDELWALRDVSFQVQQGEALGIIGRNGAGKSTLLKILSRVTAPTSGRVKVKGRIASLLEVGTGFHPELTGRENIYLNGVILGMSRREVARKFDEIVDFAEVQKFIDTPVKRYSSGMYVRLAFAVAAHLEPEILVVDEVLAVGDAEFQKKCLGKMGDVTRAGRTVLFVSHNMAAVQNLCSNCLLIEQGLLKLRGETSRVIQEYLRQYESESDFAMMADPDFYLQHFSISQEENQSTVFYTHKDIFLEFRYELPKVVRGLRIGFDLVAQDGTVLWRSFDDDSEGTLGRAKGKYVAKCVLPKNLLKPGNYRILLRIGIHTVRWISKEENFVSFMLVNTEGTNKTYADKNRPGVIMPLLNWSTSSDAGEN